MYGNAGDDVFYASQQVDWVFERPGEGVDTVIADSPNGYYLYANVEHLELINTTPFGVGNELANTITGNAFTNVLLGVLGADVLNGKAGNDVLWGEGDADVFVFERGTNLDVVGDFTPGVDKLKLVGVGYANFAEVQSHLVENGGTAAIDLGLGDIVVLNGVPMANLSAGDLLFA